MNVFKKLFRPKVQGKDFTFSSQFYAPDSEDLARGSAIGAAVGAFVGATTGEQMAVAAEINAPLSEVTVEHDVPVTKSEKLGLIPPDSYTRELSPPPDTGRATQPVVRDNPVYEADGTPRMEAGSTTFQGKGKAGPVQWSKEPILEHKLDPERPYEYRPQADTEKYISGTRQVWREKMVPKQSFEPVVKCERPIGASFNDPLECTENHEWVTKMEPESYLAEEPVYATRTVGHKLHYVPNIESQVVGQMDVPTVEFDAGVNAGAYMIKGALIGAVIGALAGGVAIAIRENYG